jgi:O-antigen/teichoic acid export membrane protein
MSFARQSLGSLVALVFGIAASIVLPRVLGAEARGEYQLAVKLAGLVLAIAQWGIPEVLLQLVAERRTPLASLVGTSFALGLAGAAVTAVVVALGALAPPVRDTLLRGVDPTLMGLALVGSLASLVGLLARRFIQLAGRVDLYNGLDVGRTAMFLLLAMLAATLLPRQAVGATAAWLVAELMLALAAGLFVWRWITSGSSTIGQTQQASFGDASVSQGGAAAQVDGHPLAHHQDGVHRGRVLDDLQVDRGLAGELARSGAPIQLGLLAMFVGNEGGAYVLNARLDLAAVGIYSVALAVSRLVLQISIALRTALQPRLVGSEADAAAVTARVTRHGLLWMVLVAAVLAVGSPLVPVVFTREFGAAGEILVLLLPGMVAYGVWQLVAGHLLRIGRRGLLAANSWLFAVAAVLLQAIGAQTLGLAGAAAGLTLAYLLGAGVATVAFLHLGGRSARELVPSPSDLGVYVQLTRGMLSSFQNDQNEKKPPSASERTSTRSATPPV